MKAAKVEILADWLEKQTLDSSITDCRIMEEIGVSNGTFYKMKPKAVEIAATRLKERQTQIEQAKTKETIAQSVNGLKTRAQRVLILQGQVDACLIDLNKRNLDIYEKVALRKTLKDLQAEISKIEGDYEKDNKQKKTEININNLTNATDEELLEYLGSTHDN